MRLGDRLDRPVLLSLFGGGYTPEGNPVPPPSAKDGVRMRLQVISSQQLVNASGELGRLPDVHTTGDTSRLAELSPICSRIAFNSRKVFSSTFVPTYGSLPHMLTVLVTAPGDPGWSRADETKVIASACRCGRHAY
jgi:hypothetical protein